MTHTLTAKEVLATYGELPLVELHAITCFASLGWETANLYNEMATFASAGVNSGE